MTTAASRARLSRRRAAARWLSPARPFRGERGLDELDQPRAQIAPSLGQKLLRFRERPAGGEQPVRALLFFLPELG